MQPESVEAALRIELNKWVRHQIQSRFPHLRASLQSPKCGEEQVVMVFSQAGGLEKEGQMWADIQSMFQDAGVEVHKEHACKDRNTGCVQMVVFVTVRSVQEKLQQLQTSTSETSCCADFLKVMIWLSLLLVMVSALVVWTSGDL